VVTLHLRADVRGHRMAPDGPPGGADRRLLELLSTVESRADYAATGELARTVDGVVTTVTWSGGGAVDNTLGATRVVGSGLLDWASRRLGTFSLGVFGGPPHDQRTVVTRGIETLSDVTEQKAVGVTAVLASSGALIALVFGDGWAIQPGSVELLSEPVELLGPRTRTTVLGWPAMTPQFAPEATVGGVRSARPVMAAPAADAGPGRTGTRASRPTAGDRPPRSRRARPRRSRW
jgi:hypothetical protein